MQKIPTLFKRDPENMRRVLPEVTPGCEWVLAGEGVPTRKFDGTCVMLDADGRWWARREVKPGKQQPANFQPIGTDENTGKTVGWEPIEQSPFAKFHAEALEHFEDTMGPEWKPTNTYELIGPKINGNPERREGHRLVPHGASVPVPWPETTYETLREWLLAHDFEGIVWHHPDGRMAKLKVRDFPNQPEGK